MFSRRAKFAGVLPPTTVPDFTVGGDPLWTPNFRTVSADPESDPIAASSASQERIYHYFTEGNSYLRQKWHAEMAWVSNATAANASVFAFKCLIKPYEIHGRRLIYSTKGSLKSGGIFVDMLDGVPRVGWYDTVQKREVFIYANVPMLDPRHWHYLYVRKRFPDTTLGSGCWTDTIPVKTAAVTNDVLLARRFRKAAANVWQQRPWDYKPHDPAHASGVTFQRNFIGLTTDIQYTVSNSTATGLVSWEDATFTGGGSGAVVASKAMYSPDMIGMYHYFVGSAVAGLYVISAVADTTHCTVVNPVTGATISMAGLGGTTGGVYLGAKLLKSPGFDTSEDPDQTSYDIELFGSHLASDPESGILPFVGEFASFAYGGFTGAVPSIFEATTADNACDGTDAFANLEIYEASATGPGELHVETASNMAFAAVDTQDVAGATEGSTKPNEKLEVALEAAPASSTSATPITWKHLQEPINLSRPRKIRLAFYDPDQGQVSNPGPELLMHPGGDDASNPSGSVTISLTNLPNSADAGLIETRAYMTQADGEVFFLVAEAPYGASSLTIAKSEDEIGRGVRLDFDNWPPADCDVLEVSQNTLACGSLRRWANSDEGLVQDAPDTVIYSKPFQPVAFPSANFFAVPDASRSGVTGLRELNGRLLVAKRDSLYRAMLHQGFPQVEIASPKIGASSGAAMVAHDGLCIFRGKRGVYIFYESGLPQWISAKVRRLFEEGLDPGEALESVGAVNPRRNQVVFTLRELESEFTSHRLSVEPIGSQGVRFSRYESPNLTALADYATPMAEVGELVGGTQEGFFVWLDRRDTHTVLLGPDEDAWGDSLHTTTACCTATGVTVTGTVDHTLAGPRGAVLRWSGGEGVVLFAKNNTLHFDRPVTNIPLVGVPATLGLPTRYWKTKWLDLADPEFEKKPRYLDVVTTVSSGTLRARARIDFNSTPYKLESSEDPLATKETTFNLSAQAVTTFDIGHLVCNHIQFEFFSTDPFEVVELVLRASDADAS